MERCNGSTPEQVIRNPSVLCSTDAEFVPAMSRSGQHVAMLMRERELSCCIAGGRVWFEVRDLQNAIVESLPLDEQDENGESRTDPVVVSERIRHINERLLNEGYRPMTLAAESSWGLEGRVELEGERFLDLGQEGQLLFMNAGRILRQHPLQKMSMHPVCCDGGLGQSGPCEMSFRALAVWQQNNIVLVRSGLNHAMDGCGSEDAAYEVYGNW